MNQTYKNIEIYVSDDGSSDETPKILAEYANKFKNVKILKSAVRLSSACANFMFLTNAKEVLADLYMFSDQDDVWLPVKVERMIAEYLKEERTRPTLMYCDMKVVDAELNILQPSFQAPMKKFRKDWRYYIQNNNISGCAITMDEALMKILRKCKFDAKQIYMHDHLFAMLAVLCGEIVYVDEALQLYRQHSNNTLGATNRESGNFIARLKKKPVKNATVRAGEILEEILKSLGQGIDKDMLKILRGYLKVCRHNLRRVWFVIRHNLFYDDDKLRWIVDNLLF